MSPSTTDYLPPVPAKQIMYSNLPQQNFYSSKVIAWWNIFVLQKSCSNSSEKLPKIFYRTLVATIRRPVDISRRIHIFSICKTKRKYWSPREYWMKLFYRVDNLKLLSSKNIFVCENYFSSAPHKGSQQEGNTGFEFLCELVCKVSIKVLKSCLEKWGLNSIMPHAHMLVKHTQDFLQQLLQNMDSRHYRVDFSVICWNIFIVEDPSKENPFPT